MNKKESKEKTELRAIIEAYKKAYPEKWEQGKKEELEAKLEAIK